MLHHGDRPVAGVDVTLRLCFTLWSVSFMLGRGSADGSCAGAHAARPCRVSFNSCVPISTAAARHWNTHITELIKLSKTIHFKIIYIYIYIKKKNQTNSKNPVLPLCSPATESIALPPLSEPTLPPCSAGEVRSVEPSVAAVLPSSSEAGAESITRAVTGKKTAGFAKGGFLKVHTNI